MQFLRRGIVIGVFLSPFSKIFAATPKPSLAPKKIGQTIIWRNRKYTAIKAGKKIIWDDGVEIRKVLASTSPSASPSQKNTVSPTPSNTPTENIPTSPPSNTPTSNATPAGTPISDAIAKSSDLIVGQTKIFKDPKSFFGASYIITRTSSGLIAFDNTCTHSGCGIEIVLSNNQVRCACHGSEFNAITGVVTLSPARNPLKQVKVTETNGEILIG